MARKRLTTESGGEVSFDHSVSHFVATCGSFRRLLAEWEAAGYAARWPAAGPDAWVGAPAANSICRALSEEIAAGGGSLLYGRHVLAARHNAAAREWTVGARNRANGAHDEHRFDVLVVSNASHQHT